MPQDRMEAVKAHLRAATLAVLAMPYPPPPGDKPVRVPGEVVRRALDHVTVDLSLPSDELETGNPRRGGLQFVMCRAILTVHVAGVALETLPERIDVARDRLRRDEIPPATQPRLCHVLAEVFVEDPAWEKAGDERLGCLVAARDPRFRHHHGPRKAGRWSKTTLAQRIKELRPEAKKWADWRRQSDP